MVFYLLVQRHLIEEVKYQTYGCIAAIAAGSLLSEMVKGRTLKEAARIDAAMLRSQMGEMPLGKEQCADIAVSALNDALRGLSRSGDGGAA